MLERIVERKKLSFEEAYELYNQMLKESEVKIAGILTALQMKGVDSEELAGFVKAMRDNAVKLSFGEVCDTCGTGGDGASTINVSTASAIVLSLFRKVAKHGNTAITSKSGSANLMETLGMKIQLTPKEAERMLKETSFAFLYAPLYHPTLRRIMPVRRELKIKTIFNILGPLSNPAEPVYQIIGVNSEKLAYKIAEILLTLKVKKALVVHGDGIDEVSPSSETLVLEVNKDIEKYRLYPEDFGLPRERILPCNSSLESAERIKAVFSGEGKKEDRAFIIANSSLALYSAEVGELDECVEIVKSVLNGRAMAKLEEIVNACPKA